MKTKIALLGIFTASILFAANSYGTIIIDYNGVVQDSIFGKSFDTKTPNQTIIAYLNNNYKDDTFKLLNGQGANSEVETWFADGVTSIILEEIAGYANNTIFGWYNADEISKTGEIFAGIDKPGANKKVSFNPAKSFGFYIDPNGNAKNRMYSQHLLNTHNDYQLTIFQVNNSNQYILGWEDLDLNGGMGGDRDYQDMIVSVTVNAAPVPEPATMLLVGTGLVGLAGLQRKRNKK